MSVLDQIRKLDEQKAKLLNDAKGEAIEAADAAISTLNELGFSYQLVEGGAPAAAPRATGTRRTGIRDEVLAQVKAHPKGITRSEMLIAMNVKGEKSGEQSVSNALAALKKAGNITSTQKRAVQRTARLGCCHRSFRRRMGNPAPSSCSR